MMSMLRSGYFKLAALLGVIAALAFVLGACRMS